MNIKEFFAVLGLDLDEKAFEKGDKALGRIAGGLKLLRVGAIAAGTALVAATFRLAHHSDELLDTKQRTGLATDALQELAFAAEKSGSSADGLNTGLRGLGRVMKQAVDGNQEAGAAFAELGVSLKDSSGKVKSTDRLFEELADRFKAMPDSLLKTAKAQEIFGKSGGDLIPVLNEGSEGIRTLRKEARDLGLVMGEDVLVNGDRVWEALGRIKDAAIGLGNVLAAPLLEPLAEFLELTVKAAKGLIAGIKWLGQHLRVLAVIVSTILITALIANIQYLIFAAHYYAVVGAAAVVAGLKAAAAWVAATWPLILIALAVAAVILILEDLWVAFQGGDSLLKKLSEAWSQWLDEVLKPNPGGHWFVEMLKDVFRFLFDIQGQWDSFMAKLAKGAKIAAPFLALVNPALGLAAGAIGYGPDLVKGMTGGGSSPSASVQTSAQAAVNSPLKNHAAPVSISSPVTVNVPATAGTPEAVGQEVEKAMRRHWDANMRDAANASAIP